MSLDAIGIVCADTAASVRFYALLGIDLKVKGGPDHFEGTTASGVRIMLDSVALMNRLNPDWKAPTGSGVVLCFLQESAGAVDHLYGTISAAGFQSSKAPWDAFWGQRYASVQDPDGHQIDLFAPL
jgi:uncharacterized glyoxalase superfamily protein PhnB